MTSHFVTTCIVAAGSLNFIRLLNNKKNIVLFSYSFIALYNYQVNVEPKS